MPKKKIPSPKEMQQWLDWFEEGMGETAIAQKAGRQPRTVQKYLLIAKEERDANRARLEYVKDVFKTHQSQLMSVVDTLTQNVSSQPAPPVLPWPFDAGKAVDIMGGTAVFSYGENRVEVDIALNIDKSLEIGLLKSHLFNDPLWGQYKGWSQGLWFYFQALATFKETAASVLAEHTDGGFADENMNPVTAGHNSEVRAERPGTMLTVTLLESVFKWLVKAVTEEWAGQKQGGIQDEARLKELGDHIRLDPERGELRWGHFHAIAFCRGREPECKQAVIEACRRLLGSPEAKHLKNSYQKLKEHGATLLNTLQIIKLGILILGECSVCKRFRRF